MYQNFKKKNYETWISCTSYLTSHSRQQTHWKDIMQISVRYFYLLYFRPSKNMICTMQCTYYIPWWSHIGDKGGPTTLVQICRMRLFYFFLSYPSFLFPFIFFTCRIWFWHICQCTFSILNVSNCAWVKMIKSWY